MQNELTSWGPAGEGSGKIILNNYRGQNLSRLGLLFEYKRADTKKFKIVFHLELETFYPQKQLGVVYNFQQSYNISTITENFFKQTFNPNMSWSLLPLLRYTLSNMEHLYNIKKNEINDIKNTEIEKYTDQELITIMNSAQIKINPQLN